MDVPSTGWPGTWCHCPTKPKSRYRRVRTGWIRRGRVQLAWRSIRSEQVEVLVVLPLGDFVGHNRSDAHGLLEAFHLVFLNGDEVVDEGIAETSPVERVHLQDVHRFPQRCRQERLVGLRVGRLAHGRRL